MTDTTHDPPAHQAEPPLTAAQLAVLHVQRHATYALMREKLGSEPLELIRTMKHGGYRFKCKRGYPGVLVLDKEGNPVPERMSFRQIAPILSQQSGVQVTYETIRRWWEAVFPGEPDEPTEPEIDSEDLRDASLIVVKAAMRKRRVTRRTPAPAVGDDHAEAIRAATEKARSTNPAVPAAAFLPPAE